MQDKERYVLWCLNQNKGIRLVTPSSNLMKAYLKKAGSALKSMDINAEAGITEWAVSASYYARYFTVYALFQKIGVKCEIHDCTIALFEYLFSDSVPTRLIRELHRSKNYRIESQYYTQEITINLEQMISETKNFVLEIEKILDNLNPEQVTQMQNRLKELKT
jgi:uncharacterized protein (UPF0332 family)